MTRVLAEYTQTIDTPQVLGTFLAPSGILRITWENNEVPCRLESIDMQSGFSQRGSGFLQVSLHGSWVRVRALSAGICNLLVEHSNGS